ncbi:MAG: GNAT family N-acetyltransferase [Phycisphaerales bacterium]|nr:MAG: GNAT family N-acetyltransferase [Phycisphaerales bacterium]
MLEGERTRLRAYTKEDLPLRRAFLNDLELLGMAYPGILFPSRPEDQEKWYESLDSKSDKQYSFAVESKNDSVYVGCCTVFEIDAKNRSASVGMFIGKPHWRKGYGSDALRTLLRFCFEEINLNKVMLEVYSFNTPAIRCYEKLGFKTEGVLRQTLYRDGQYHDTVAMGMLRSEWDAEHGGD